MYVCFYVNCLLCFQEINQARNFSTCLGKVLPYQIFFETPSCGSRVVRCRRTDVQTDNHDETKSHFSEIFEAPNIVQFIIHVKHSQGTYLRLFDSKGQPLITK
jgi:hypothetical protein